MICKSINQNNGSPKFSLGEIVATRSAIEAIEDSGQSPAEFLRRHVSGDWGIVDADDKAANDESVIDGSRILSAYKTIKGVKLWIITEAEDDDGNRATTILLPRSHPFEQHQECHGHDLPDLHP